MIPESDICSYLTDAVKGLTGQDATSSSSSSTMDSSNAKDFCVIVSYVGPDADSMVSQVLPMNAP